jgi:hypothetical protein
MLPEFERKRMAIIPKVQFVGVEGRETCTEFAPRTAERMRPSGFELMNLNTESERLSD